MTVTTTGAAVVKLVDPRGPVLRTPFPELLQAARALLAFAICLTIATFAVGKRQLFRRLAAAIALFLLTVTAG
jgi:hypothetical protein